MEESISRIVTVIFEEHLFSIILHFALVYIGVSLVKSMATTVQQYILLKTGLFGIGSIIEYKGERGVITHLGIRWVTIKFNDRKMYIHTTEQTKMYLIIPDIKHDQTSTGG